MQLKRNIKEDTHTLLFQSMVLLNSIQLFLIFYFYYLINFILYLYSWDDHHALTTRKKFIHFGFLPQNDFRAITSRKSLFQILIFPQNCFPAIFARKRQFEKNIKVYINILEFHCKVLLNNIQDLIFSFYYHHYLVLWV